VGRLPMKRGRKYAIQEIWDTHHEILRRLMLGQKSVDIAADLGVSEAMVSYTKNSPVCQKQLEIMHGARDAEFLDVATEIRKMVPNAVKLMAEALVDPDEKLGDRLKVAFEVLERESPKIRKFEGAVGYYTADDIERLKARGRQQAIESGVMVLDS